MSTELQRLRVVVVGSMMTDMISNLSRFPTAGETVMAGRFELGFGVRGRTKRWPSVGLVARWRWLVAWETMCSAIARYLILLKEGIDVSGIERSDQAASGVAPIWVEPDGTNRIACVGGANNEVDPKGAAAAIRRFEPQIVMGQFEIPQSATVAAFEAAKSRGATTILNPAPAAYIEPEMIELVDWLILNESEFACVSGTDGWAVGRDSALAEFAARIPARLVVTLGGNGAAFVGDDGGVYRMSAVDVDEIDTSGAGDAFVGAFAVGLAAGRHPEAAMALAIATASDTVTRRGTQSSLPDHDECVRLLDIDSRARLSTSPTRVS